MANKIVLLGGGEHCKSVLDTLRSSCHYDEIFISDPSLEIGLDIYGAKVVGGDDFLARLINEDVKYAFVTTGSVGNLKSLELRRRLYYKAKDLGFKFPNIIDNSAIVSDSAKLQEGVFVGKRVVINTDACIGNTSIINTGAIVEHECVVGDFSHVSIGAVLAGTVRLGENTFIGANATIIQGKTIGMNSVVGAGALVNRDLPDNCVAVGVPVRIL